jgi:hypothetical protein
MNRIFLTSVAGAAISLAGGCRYQAPDPTQAATIAETVLISHSLCNGHDDCAKRNVIRSGTFSAVSINQPASGVFVEIYGVRDEKLFASLPHEITRELPKDSPCVRITVSRKPYSFQGNTGSDTYICQGTRR